MTKKNLSEVKGMDERDFELLYALSQQSNITKTAASLFMTQSSLSKRLSALEAELGVQLFVRSRHGVRLTPEGEEVLASTRQAAQCLAKMREKLAQRQGGISGTVNMAVSINIALYYLPDLLVKCRTRYPNIKTHVRSGQSMTLYDQFAAGKFDLAIFRGEWPFEGEQVLLARERLCVVTSAEDAHKPLTQLPYLARKSDSALDRSIMRWMREQNLHPNQDDIVTDNILTVLNMASRGLGWGIVPEICLQGFEGHVRPMTFKNGEPFTRSTYLLYQPWAYELPQVRALIDLIRAERWADAAR